MVEQKGRVRIIWIQFNSPRGRHLSEGNWKGTSHEAILGNIARAAKEYLANAGNLCYSGAYRDFLVSGFGFTSGNRWAPPLRRKPCSEKLHGCYMVLVLHDLEKRSGNPR
ncbi:uncharacterized protein METZ01_LOCUS389821, partial [marine metagenome]